MRDDAAPWTRLLRESQAASRRGDARRRRLGSPRHAVGCLDRPASAARAQRLHRARTRARRARGIGPPATGGRRRGGVGGPARLGPGRVVAIRLGPVGVVAALSALGSSRRRRAAHARDRRGGRIPRTRLGPEPADDGRDGRRATCGPHDDLGARCAGPVGSRRTPPATGAAVRLHCCALRTRTGSCPDREHARRAVHRVALATRGRDPARAPACRRGPGRRGRRGGGALHFDRPVGAPGPRHVVPPQPG